MLTSYSSATASDLHRLPYSAVTSCHGHLMKTLCMVTFVSIPIGFLYCQCVECTSDCGKRDIQAKEKMVRYIYHHVKKIDYCLLGELGVAGLRAPL
jgi:hypothetical protein